MCYKFLLNLILLSILIINLQLIFIKKYNFINLYLILIKKMYYKLTFIFILIFN